jgi:hypothetical protein
MRNGENKEETVASVADFVRNAGTKEDFQIFDQVARGEDISKSDINDFTNMMARLMTEFEETAESGPKRDGKFEKGIKAAVGTSKEVLEEGNEAMSSLITLIEDLIKGREEDTQKILDLLNQSNFYGNYSGS